MKKIIAILMAVVLVLSLAACTGSKSDDTPTTVKHELDYYSNDFYGLQLYLVDYGLVPYVDLAKFKPSTASDATPAEADTTGVRTALYYDEVGAVDGVRFLLTADAFIEVYDFTGATGAKAKATLDAIKKDGKITVVEGMDPLNGKISKGGSFVILYNEKNDYEYDEILKVLDLGKW